MIPVTSGIRCSICCKLPVHPRNLRRPRSSLVLTLPVTVMLGSMQADRARLFELNARIVDLERSLSALHTKQDLVQERLDAYKYPVLTLPNEITSLIFLHFLPIYPAAPPLSGLDSPTSLTYVCRHWRDVALGTPALWRAIKLIDHFDNIMTYAYEQRRHICDAWIKRSRSFPLSIGIEINDYHGVLPEPLTMATTRWEHLSLCGPVSCLPKLGGSMPMLRSLYLSSSPQAFGSDDFYEGPRLLAEHVVSTIILPWIQLTCLTLEYVGIDRCVQILKQTVNLVQCDLTLTYNAGPGLDNLTSLDLALPRLESLVLKEETPWQTPVLLFFHSFIVPSLCRLELAEIFLRPEPTSALGLFITKSGCRLQDVCITFSRGTTTDHESYRLAFPSIPTFSFHRYNRPIGIDL
ncbi:hypothetical protein B0H12DRAFT_1223662 [Mycena haematopus]|nr:hypothetical protein B0H12DRAFT_1223662 [Mycena haematopus]